MRRILEKEIDFGFFRADVLGLILHGLVGLGSVILSIQIPMTIIYTMYQLVDYVEGEEGREIMGDLVEFGIGLSLGSILRIILRI